MDKAQEIWRDMKVRKYGAGNGGGLGGGNFLPMGTRNGGTGGGATGSSAESKNPVSLRDVRRSHVGLWRV